MIEISFNDDLLPNQFYINKNEHGDLYIIDNIYIDTINNVCLICSPFGDISTKKILLNKPKQIIIKYKYGMPSLSFKEKDKFYKDIEKSMELM